MLLLIRIFLLLMLLPFTGLAQATPKNETNIPGFRTATEQRGETLKIRPERVAKLPGRVNETSGLLFVDGKLFTINDGGNTAEILQIDIRTGTVIKTIHVRNAQNKDWESITCDSNNIYIGDFGNNLGTRRDLSILKISRKDFLNPVNDSVDAQYIFFNYPDQQNFSQAMLKTNFDCEAFIYYEGALHLFTKNWLDYKTKHYTLPTTAGTYQAQLMNVYDVKGLITDACISESGTLALIGYYKKYGKFYRCFTWVLDDFKADDLFSGRSQRIETGSVLRLGQTEGCCFEDENSLLISGESILGGWLLQPARLVRLKVIRK